MKMSRKKMFLAEKAMRTEAYARNNRSCLSSCCSVEREDGSD